MEEQKKGNTYIFFLILEPTIYGSMKVVKIFPIRLFIITLWSNNIFHLWAKQQQLKMEEYPSFMTCILRIDVTAEKWQRTVDKVLKHVEVTNFRMNTDGMVDISGTVYPNKFLKILRKARTKAELCHFQFGECSSNLFLPSRPVDNGITNKYGGPNNILIHSLIGQKQAQPGHFGGRDGRFLHYGDKPSQLKNLKDSSKGNAGGDHNHNRNHAHGRDNHRNHNHVHRRDHNYNHVHGREHNYRHNHGHDKDRDCINRDQFQWHGGQHVEWEKPESKLEHAPGCINATTPRPKVQLDCEKQIKGRAEPLKSQGVNSCCLM